MKAILDFRFWILDFLSVIPAQAGIQFFSFATGKSHLDRPVKPDDDNRKGKSWLTLFMIFVLLIACPIWTFAESARMDYRLDNELFRRGLIDRGFDEWLKVYDKQHPPVSDLDLLAQQIGKAWLDYRRTKDPQKRNQAMETLLQLELDRVESYPEHPLSANWRVRYASDLLNEKLGSWAFVQLLNLDLPPQQRQVFQTGLDQVERQVNAAKEFLKAKLSRFEHLDNAQLTQINRQGLPELYAAAVLQSDYLRAWCWFHRAKLFEPDSPRQVKILYQLSDLLDRLGTDGSRKLLAAGVARMLGKCSQAKPMLSQARKMLPATYFLFTDIEQSLLALAENQPQAAIKIITSAQQAGFYKSEPSRQEMAALALGLLEGQARLKMLSADEQTDVTIRNRIWKKITAVLMEKPRLCVFAFPKILEYSKSCSQNSLADIELYAHAEQSVNFKKLPLAKSEFENLLSRREAPVALKISAALFLSRTLEQEGRFSDAVKVLHQAGGLDQNLHASEILAESARLSWLAYRSAPNVKQRSLFITDAGRLLERFPQSESADQFKLLMAEEFSQSGEFNQALQWVRQVPPGSPMYLQAKAATVLVLSRKFTKQAQSPVGASTQPDSMAQLLADQIESACRELVLIASAKQKQPEAMATWTLDNNQAQLMAEAILATANVLSDPAVGRGSRAEAILRQYRPILAQYEKTSKSAVISQIMTLIQTATTGSLFEAIHLTKKLVDKNELPPREIIITAAACVLESIHQAVLAKEADPLAPADDLSLAGFNLAQLINTKYLKSKNLSADLVNRFHLDYIVTSVDAGQYEQFSQLITKFPEKNNSLDLDLARARMALNQKQYLDAVRITMADLQNSSPADNRYWHALIINLRAHLALGSDPGQIAAAVVARQQEYPDLGGPATKKELLKILTAVQETKKKN
ncbi:MAG: hypothetical protein WC975_02850 [Phycisphaerae bacterium]